MEGKGEMNVFGSATLLMDHYEIFDVIKNKIHLNEGSFRIWNENGTELYGQYSGVTNLGENLIVKAFVNGGTGEFKNSYGSITLELVDQGNSEYLAWVTGIVRLREGANPPTP